MNYKITITLFFLLIVTLSFETIPSSYASETQEFQNAEIISSSKTTTDGNDEKHKQLFDAHNKIIQFMNTLSKEDVTESSSKQTDIIDKKIPIIFSYMHEWGPILVIGIDDTVENVNNYREQIAEIIDNRNIALELVPGKYNIESCKTVADRCYISESMSDADIKYKAPLRQIRDDGLSPENVRCNEGKVLFFKISNKTPVCIYEKSIEHFSNDFIGWFGTHNESFLNRLDHNYLIEKNSILDRETTVTYRIVEEANKKEDTIQNNNIVYYTQEKITNINDSNSVMYDPVYENDLYRIIDSNGNDPIDWDDPRTSTNFPRWTIEDVGKMHNLMCDGQKMNFYGLLSNESSFKILENTTSVLLDYDDRVFLNDYEQRDNDEFKHTFWSQGKTEFVFEDNLEEIGITERTCKTTLLPKVYLYEVIFRVVS